MRIALLTLASPSLLAAPAFAADDDDSATKLDRVEVTGSRIKRTQLEGAMPVTSVTREDIDKTGLASIGDLLQLTLEQLKATTKAKDLTTLISKQRELGTKFVEKAQARQKDLAEIASESQAGFAKWIEDATALALGKA